MSEIGKVQYGAVGRQKLTPALVGYTCHSYQVSGLRWLLLFLVFLSQTSTYAQDTPDMDLGAEKLEQLPYDSLRSIYRAIFMTDIDSAATIAKAHYQKAATENDKIQLIYALNNRATNSALSNDHALAVKYIDEAIAIKKELNDTILPDPKTYYNAGYVYDYVDQGQSLRFYYRAIEEFEVRGDSASIADVHNNMGSMYMIAGNLDKSLEFLTKAKGMYERLSTKSVDPYILQNIGKVKLKKGKFHEAIYHLEEAEARFTAENNRSRIIYSRAYKSEAYASLGLDEKAMSELESASMLADSLSYDAGILFINPVIARQYIKSDIAKAVRYIQKAVDVSDTKKSYQNKAEIYLTLSYIEKEKGNLEESLSMHELYSLYRDSSVHGYNEADLVKEELDREHKSTIDKVRQEYDAGQEGLMRRHTVQLTVLACVSLFLLWGGSVMYKKRQRKQKVEQELLLEEIESLKMESMASPSLQTQDFELDREKIEAKIGKAINETDWKVMNILLEDPVITNKGIAEKAYLSVDGIGSSLRRMYRTFDIKESRYMKVSLIMELMKISR